MFSLSSGAASRALRSFSLESATTLAFVFLPALSVAAEKAPPSEPPAHIPVTVVTATRFATPESQLGSSFSVVTATDIERNQWRTLPQALASIPGMNVVQAGGPGGATTVFMRGANSNQTKVIVDGITVNDPSKGGLFNFGTVLTADIERIEVLRGPQSSLYGSDAIGGVINIITKRGRGPARVTARLEGGSFDTFNQTVSATGATDRFHYAVTAAHLRAGDTPVTPLNLLPPARERVGDQYENTTFSTRLGVDVSDAAGIDFVARYSDADLDFTGADYSVYPSVPAAAQSTQGDEQLFARTSGHFSLFDGKFNNQIGVGYTRYRTRVQSPPTLFGPVPDTVSRGTRIAYDWQGDWQLAPGQTLVFGLEHKVDRIENSPLTADNSNAAAFAELQSRINPQLHFALSVRRDRNERFGAKSTWRIAPTYTFEATGTRLKASYGTGFKAPSLTQLFVSYPAFNFFANPNLDPEESEGYDLGFEQPLAGDRVRIGATYFHNDITNLIVSDATGTSLSNAGKVLTHGVESFFSWSVARTFTVRVNYTYTIAEDEATDQQLLRRPKRRASMDLSWQPSPRLSLSATALHVGTWVDGNRSFTIPRLDAQPYSVVNLAARYRFDHGVTVFGRIDNALDESYENPVGFLHPGRGAFVGIEAAFGG